MFLQCQFKICHPIAMSNAHAHGNIVARRLSGRGGGVSGPIVE